MRTCLVVRLPGRRAPAILIESMVIATLVLMSPASTRGESASDAGYVMELRGDWQLYADGKAEQPTGKLHKWQSLPAGSVVRIATPSIEDFITIADPQWRPIIVHKCQPPPACYQPLFLPGPKASDSKSILPLLKEVLYALSSEPNRYSLHRTRGSKVQYLQAEGILPLINGRIDLRDIMHPAEKGVFLITAVSRAEDRKFAQRFEWNPNQARAINSDVTLPGLYDIQSDDAVPLAQIWSARIILCAPSQCPKLNQAFEVAREITAGWHEKVTSGTIHQFLRAYLAELAVTTESKK